jgi:hypothetical protein
MLPSDMAHDGKYEHCRNQGKTRLAIPSRPDYALHPPFQREMPQRASTPRHSIVPPRTIRNPPHPEYEFPQSTSRSNETALPKAHLLSANARLKLSATHSKISPLKTPNRERIALSTRNFSNRSAPDSARHSSLITRHFLSNRNSRITGFHLTPLTTILTQFLTATNTHFWRTRGSRTLALMLPAPHHSHHFSFHGIIGLLCSQ